MVRALLTCLLSAALLFAGLHALAADKEGAAPKPDAQPEPKQDEKKTKQGDRTQASIDALNKAKLGLTIDRKKGQIDIKATVCLRSAEYLELLACTKDSKEHESIFVIDAKPSTIHLSLLLLGQKPGKPLTWDRSSQPAKLLPAKGPKVEIFIVQTVKGKQQETPANQWVQIGGTKQVMKNNTWLFAGSATSKLEGKEIYLADVNGSAISLVSFGDDLLALPNKMTQDNKSQDKVWVPRTKVIPKVGTKVLLRLKVKADKADKADNAAGQGKDDKAKDGEKKAKPAG